MNVKKLVFIGAIALVVIGCVLAAGCTSNQSTTPATPTTAPSTTEKIDLAKELIGTWEFPFDETSAKEFLNQLMKQDPDSAKKFQELSTEKLANLKEVMIFSDDGSVILKYALKTGEDFEDVLPKCTWKKVNETAIQINSANGQSFMLTFDPATKILKQMDGSSKYTKIANANSAAETKQDVKSNTTTSAKDLIGTWEFPIDETSAKEMLNKMMKQYPDYATQLQKLGTENLVTLKEVMVFSDDGSVIVKYASKTGEDLGDMSTKCTWKKVNETAIQINAANGQSSMLTFDSATKTLKQMDGTSKYTKITNA